MKTVFLSLLIGSLALSAAEAMPPYDGPRPASGLSRAERERNLDYLCFALRVRAPRPERWDVDCDAAAAELKAIDDTRGFYYLLNRLIGKFETSHTHFLNLPQAPKRRPVGTAPEKAVVVMHSPRGLGIIKFQDFRERGSGVFKEYQAALERLKDAPAILIDLRGNPGGHVDTPGLVASTLIRKKVRLETAPTPPLTSSEVRGPPRPRGEEFQRHPDVRVEKPVAALVDRNTESAAEYLALILRLGGVPLVGARTGGKLVADKRVFDLPCGLRVEEGLGSYLQADGTPVEGNGLAPDVVGDVEAAEELLLRK